MPDISVPEAQVIAALLVLIGVIITGYWQYGRRKKGDSNNEESPKPTIVRTDPGGEVKVVGDETLAAVAKESLNFLQKMLEQSIKNENDLRETVKEMEQKNAELRQKNSEKDELIDRLKSQLSEQIQLNHETAIELSRLRGRLHERQGE